MNRVLSIIFCFCSLNSNAQVDTSRWIRAFPITSYMVDVSDSVKLVQVQLPVNVKAADKQIGVLKGMYRDQHSDTAYIGVGRCNLIKADYYYFSINYKQSGKQPREGDLLFIMTDKRPVYRGNIVKLATLYIGLQNVYEQPFYDRNAVFNQWQKKDEDIFLDSAVVDIHFTGDYFLANNPSMNVKVKGGKYDGKMVLNVMITCTKQDVTDLIEYMIARPNLYAGHVWKISEIFATWLSEGAPTVMKG